MVNPKLAFIAAALALTAAPALAQVDPQAACDRCAAPQTQTRWVSEADHADYTSTSRRVQQTYTARTERFTRTAYSESYLSWPGKDGRDEAAEGPESRPGPGAQEGPACPPVNPGERVISCRYRPFAPPAPQADNAPMMGVLYADGGVGPDFIPSGGGGGGGITIIGGGSGSGSGSGSASSSSSAFASASVNASISLDARFGFSGHRRGGYGGGGSPGCGCTTTGSGGMSGWGGQSMGHGGSHGHGRR